MCKKFDIQIPDDLMEKAKKFEIEGERIDLEIKA